jgi:hypothetical protein
MDHWTHHQAFRRAITEVLRAGNIRIHQAITEVFYDLIISAISSENPEFPPKALEKIWIK